MQREFEFGSGNAEFGKKTKDWKQIPDLEKPNLVIRIPRPAPRYPQPETLNSKASFTSYALPSALCPYTRPRTTRICPAIFS